MDCILVWGVEPFVEAEDDMRNESIHQLQEFIENEARPSSMDFGCVTPLYVYRM